MPESKPCPKCGLLYVWDGSRCCHKSCRYGSGKNPLKLKVKIVGVYPVEAAEPVHLVEISIAGPAESFDVGAITQEVAGTPRINWQTPYDEQVISESGGKTRMVFFFHHLDLSKPLLTPACELALPKPKERPARLKDTVYNAP